MTRSTSKAETAKSKISYPSESLASMWPMSGAGLSAPTAIEGFRKVSELQMEVARFATECARKNAGTLAAFAACRTPMDFLDVWRRAAIDAVSDYADETARILDRAEK